MRSAAACEPGPSRVVPSSGKASLGPGIRSRLSTLVHEHIDFHGSYPFVRQNLAGALRPLHDPAVDDA